MADREVAGVKGACRTWQDSLVARFAQAEYEEKYDRLARMKQIDFVDTHAAAYRRDLILAHGGFDPGFALEEDQEFSFRMAEAGHKLVFAPAAVVYHRHPPTISRYFQRKMQLGGWKVSVLARYPSKALCDSHTPWTRKAQILLLPLTLGAAMAAVLDLVPWIVIALLAVSSLASTIPLVPKAGQQGWHVAAATPVLALLRALALDLGMAWGVARWPGPKRWQGDKMQTRCPGGTSRVESGLM